MSLRAPLGFTRKGLLTRALLALAGGASLQLLVRATVGNPEGLLKPDILASVTILPGERDNTLAVPRDAIIYEGRTARIWVARDNRSVEAR